MNFNVSIETMRIYQLLAYYFLSRSASYTMTYYAFPLWLKLTRIHRRPNL